MFVYLSNEHIKQIIEICQEVKGPLKKKPEEKKVWSFSVIHVMVILKDEF